MDSIMMKLHNSRFWPTEHWREQTAEDDTG